MVMKKETKKRLKNFTLDVIDLFLGVPESIVYAFDRKEFYRLLQGMQTDKVLTCSNISRIINNFKKRGYIEIKKSNGGESIQFTRKAKMAIIDRLAERSESSAKNRFISFDVPELLKSNRDGFRRTIKKMSFRQVQKSLWVCNKNLGNLVELAAAEYKVEKYVVYIASSYSNIDDQIKDILKGN